MKTRDTPATTGNTPFVALLLIVGDSKRLACQRGSEILTCVDVFNIMEIEDLGIHHN